MESRPGATEEEAKVEGVRAFVAVEVAEVIRSRIAKLYESLADHHFPVRWVRPEGIHLTLKFLGQVPCTDLPRIMEAITKGTAGSAPFTMTVQGFGVFPNFRRPRVLWVGLTGQIDALKALQESIDREFEKIGFEKENRPFSPHVTIGRVQENARPSAILSMGEELKDVRPGNLGTWTVGGLRLMRSQIQRGGAIYSALEEFNLG
jgi:RNA 2',3'-cyclic 3'-phosphodiesterase